MFEYISVIGCVFVLNIFVGKLWVREYMVIMVRVSVVIVSSFCICMSVFMFD